MHLDPVPLLQEGWRDDVIAPQQTATGFDLHWPVMCLDDPEVMAATGEPCATFSEEKTESVTFAELGIAPRS